MCHILCLQYPFFFSWMVWKFMESLSDSFRTHDMMGVIGMCFTCTSSLQTCFAIRSEGKMTLSFSALPLTTRGSCGEIRGDPREDPREDPSLSCWSRKEADRKPFLPQYLLCHCIFFSSFFPSFLLILSKPLKGSLCPFSQSLIELPSATSVITDQTHEGRDCKMKEMQLVKSLVKITIEKQRDRQFGFPLTTLFFSWKRFC